MPSILQRLWDREISRTKLMLVLCGSSIGMMEGIVLGYRAPLYGRRTGQYLLEPLKFHDARRFFKRFSREDQVRTYAVLGGTPAYLRLLSSVRGLEDLLSHEILCRGTFLYDEARFLLQQELREPRSYFAVLEAVAGGKTKLNAIKQSTGIEGVTAYLSTLQELRLVERIVRLTERPPAKSRRGLYRLRDPFLRFWFRFVHPHRTMLEQGAGREVLQTRIRPALDDFTAPSFEEICRQYLWRLRTIGKLPLRLDQISNWWLGGEEVDVLGLGEDVLLAECKWTSRPANRSLLEDLERKRSLVENDLGRAATHPAIFSRGGFTPGLVQAVQSRSDVFLIDLGQLVDCGPIIPCDDVVAPRRSLPRP